MNTRIVCIQCACRQTQLLINLKKILYKKFLYDYCINCFVNVVLTEEMEKGYPFSTIVQCICYVLGKSLTLS